MEPRNIPILPKPLPSADLAIGQFVLDPLHPSADFVFSSRVADIEELNDYFIQVRYKDLLAVDNEGRFVRSYGAKFDLGKMWRQPNLLSVKADQMICRTLKDVKEAFNIVCDDDVVQDWIKELAEKGHTFYFVAGVKELQNATIRRAVLRDGGVSNRLDETPLEAGARLPRNIARSNNLLGVGREPTVSGVFALDVRSVVARIEDPSKPHGLDDLNRTWSYHEMPNGKQLIIGLGGQVKVEALRDMLDLSEDDVKDTLTSISHLSLDIISQAASPMLRASSPALRGRSPSPNPAMLRL